MNRISFSLACLWACLLPASAFAANATYFVFMPQTLDMGGVAVETYVPEAYSAPRLAGAALADSSMTELRRRMPEASGITVAVSGVTAVIAVKDGATAEGDMDRVLGAVYHTLRMTGVTKVKYDGKSLSASSFSRGAITPLLPLNAALPPTQLPYGYVVVGDDLLEASEFYRRLGGGDNRIRAAATALLEKGSPAVKLQILDGIYALRLKDRYRAIVPRLRDDNVTVRLKAIGMLQGVKDHKVLKTLEFIVAGDGSSDVKSEAAKILVDAGRKSFEKYLLLEKLQSKDAAEVVEAARALLETGDARFAAAFAELCAHSNPGARQVGVQGLIKYKQLGTMVDIVSSGEASRDVAEPFSRVLTDDGSGRQRSVGIGWLLKNGSGAGAAYAARAAGDKRVPGTAEHLAAALKRTEQEVRLAVAVSLGQLKDTIALEAIAQALRMATAAEEQEALTAAAIEMISVQPLEQVIRIAQSPNVTIRQLSVKSLAQFAQDSPNPRVLNELYRYLEDSEEEIRRAAAFALARIRNRNVVKRLIELKGNTDPVIRQQVAFALAHPDEKQGADVLRDFLRDRDNRVKYEAVRGLRVRKVVAELGRIKQLTGYRQADIRREAVQAVLEMGSKTDMELFALWRELVATDSNADIRLMAVEGLSSYVHEPGASGALGMAVTDKVPAVKLRALDVLAASEDMNVVEQVLRGLFDDTREVKLKALAVLEQLASPKSAKALQEFVLNETDEDLRVRANKVLGLL